MADDVRRGLGCFALMVIFMAIVLLGCVVQAQQVFGG